MTQTSKQDRRDAPRYTPREAAHHLSLPPATARAWSVGYEYGNADGKPNRFQPLIVPATRAPLTLSFWNLVELYVLTSLRRRYKVPMPTVRSALRYTARELGVRRPLIEQTFYTDGIALFVDRLGGLVDATDGQTVIREFLADSLKRVDRGDDGHVLRLYPWLNDPKEPRAFEVDPQRAFGRLVLKGTGVPTEVIAERFRAGESIGSIASDFGMPADRIEQALRWEQCAPSAA